jgi:hypothetical protein
MNPNLIDPSSNKCLYQTSDGRTCRMLRKKGHASLCIHHAREEQQQLESEKLAAEFASLSGKLNTVTDINHVLGKVFTALAEKRISHQTAETFGYLGQLLLQSIPGVKSEMNAAVQHSGAYEASSATTFPFFAGSASNEASSQR